jgi:hypothetical protein
VAATLKLRGLLTRSNGSTSLAKLRAPTVHEQASEQGQQLRDQQRADEPDRSHLRRFPARQHGSITDSQMAERGQITGGILDGTSMMKTWLMRRAVRRPVVDAVTARMSSSVWRLPCSSPLK